LEEITMLQKQPNWPKLNYAINAQLSAANISESVFERGVF
jgi:hypothetical protein